MAAKNNDRLTALAFNCSLKSSGNKEKSSTDVLLRQCSTRWPNMA